MMGQGLAIAAPSFSVVSGTFIRAHVRTILPGATIVIAQHADGVSDLGVPALAPCPSLESPSTLAERIAGSAGQRWRRHVRAGLRPADFARPDRVLEQGRQCLRHPLDVMLGDEEAGLAVDHRIEKPLCRVATTGTADADDGRGRTRTRPGSIHPRKGSRTVARCDGVSRVGETEEPSGGQNTSDVQRLMTPTCDLVVNATPRDLPLLRILAPHMIDACAYPFRRKVLVMDLAARRGAYSESVASVPSGDFAEFEAAFDEVMLVREGDEWRDDVLTSFFAHGAGRRSDHRGGPIYQYRRPMLSSDAAYVCHLDCDILFHVRPGYCWIAAGIEVLRRHADVVAVVPHSGPPADLAAYAQPGRVVERGDLRLVDSLSSRKFLIPTEWLRGLAPLTAQRVPSRRTRLRALFTGASTLLPLEVHLTNMMRAAGVWRAELPAADAWALHCPDHSDRFMRRLPAILSRIAANAYPPVQAGQYDLDLDAWERMFAEERNTSAL